MSLTDGRDALNRFVFERARVRGELVSLDAEWQAMVSRHGYPAPLLSVLGELTAACTLLAATVKFAGGSLILQIQGGGPVNRLVVQCQADLGVRATATWEGDLDWLGPAPTLRALTSGGRCVMTIDPGPGRQAYQGIVPLEGVTTEEVLQRYMLRSEQIETRFRLAATEKRARGLLLQRLPPEGGKAEGPAPEDGGLWAVSAELVEGLAREDVLERQPGELLSLLYHGEALRLFDSAPVRFACSCSRDRIAGAIRMIGAEEARSILAAEGHISMKCEFCSQTYVFDRQQTEEALADVESETPPSA